MCVCVCTLSMNKALSSQKMCVAEVNVYVCGWDVCVWLGCGCGYVLGMCVCVCACTYMGSCKNKCV